MIKLGERPDMPASLSSKTVVEKKEQLKQRVLAGQRLGSNDFPAYWRNDDVREPLWSIHHGKCCYCERKREIKRESDIEHYRPKSEVAGEDNHPGYWWLAYEWTNYLYSCKPCNESFKRNFFPLLGESVRVTGPDEDMSIERPMIINPIDDEPERCISYDWWTGGGVYVKAIGLDDEGRGSGTIRILNLNRLMEERAEHLTLLETLANSMIYAQEKGNQLRIEKLADDIRAQTSAKKQMVGFKRAFFGARGLGEFVATH